MGLHKLLVLVGCQKQVSKSVQELNNIFQHYFNPYHSYMYVWNKRSRINGSLQNWAKVTFDISVH